MLVIDIPSSEIYDEKTQEFRQMKGQTLTLEHSLMSISKWESKWHKRYLEDNDKTREEVLDYIRCMTITQNVDPDIYNHLSTDVINKINEYIQDPHTATTFSERDARRGAVGKQEKVSAELIYYWMIAYNIPVEFQKWHLEKLLTLIRICSIKAEEQNGGQKKMSRKELASRNASLNAKRRKALHTRG